MFSRGYLLSQMGFDCLAFEDSLVSRKNLNMSIFHPSQCYFIDENETYTSKQLNEHFNQHTLMYHDIEQNWGGAKIILNIHVCLQCLQIHNTICKPLSKSLYFTTICM